MNMVELEELLVKKYSEDYLNEIFNPDVQKVLILETYKGDIVIELFHKDVSLVKEVITRALLGYFDGMTFHNCNPFFLQLRKNIADTEGQPKEILPYLRNVRGTVGFVNSKKKASNSLVEHFYICLKDIPEFDGKYTIIGRVIKGLDVLNKMWDGNTVKAVYIAKNYSRKQRIGKRLSFLFWIGLILALFYFLRFLSDKIPALINLEENLIGKTLVGIIPYPFDMIVIILAVLLMVVAVVVAPLARKAVEMSVDTQYGKKEGLTAIRKGELKEQRSLRLEREHEKFRLEEERSRQTSEEERLKAEEEDRGKEEKIKKQEERLRKLEEGRIKKEEDKKKVAELRIREEVDKKKIEEEKQKSEELKKYEESMKRLESEKIKEEEYFKKQIAEEQEKRKKLEEENKKKIEEEEKKRHEEEEKRKRLDELIKKEKEHEIGFEKKPGIIAKVERAPEKPVEKIEETEELKKQRQEFVGKMSADVDIKKEIKKKNKEEIKQEFLPQIAKRTETQLDVLYDLLENYGLLKLSYIIKTFNIDKDEALEWCNILVEHGLAELSYPAFGEPILKKKDGK